VHAYGDYAAVAALPISAGLGYFYPSFGDKINLVMFIYSGLLFLNATWQMLSWQIVVSFIWLQVPRSEEKKRKKERRLLVFF
jgi:hypothetical protein